VTGQGELGLDRLTQRYGDVQDLDGLTFTVPPGQVVGFLGPNGAGKTTAMRAIVGVAAMDSGTVRWGGEPIAMAARRRIGYMPEEQPGHAGPGRPGWRPVLRGDDRSVDTDTTVGGCHGSGAGIS